MTRFMSRSDPNASFLPSARKYVAPRNTITSSWYFGVLIG